MFKKVLLVCVGNICRSITAERLFREKIPSLQFDSAGLGALVGKPADEVASEVAQKRGLDLSNHNARQFNKKIAGEYDLILVMEKDHLEGVSKIAPEVRGKTMLLAKWTGNKDIPDPYRRSTEVYEITYDLIEKSVEKWMKYLEK